MIKKNPTAIAFDAKEKKFFTLQNYVFDVGKIRR